MKISQYTVYTCAKKYEINRITSQRPILLTFPTSEELLLLDELILMPTIFVHFWHSKKQ